MFHYQILHLSTLANKCQSKKFLALERKWEKESERKWAPQIRWLALPRRDLRRCRSLRPAAWQRPTAPEHQDEDQDKDRDEVGDAGDEGDLETGDGVQLRCLLINFA